MLRPLVLCCAAHSACGFVTPATSSTKLAPLRSGGPPVVERPSPDILLSARDDQTQQLGFAAICGGIAVGTAACVAGLDALESILPDGWFGAWRDYTWPLPLGGWYLRGSAIGRRPFTWADALAWRPLASKRCGGGLWQVPAPGAEELNLSYAEYHCYWTGVAEFLGGVGLAGAGLELLPLPVQLPGVPVLCWSRPSPGTGGVGSTSSRSAWIFVNLHDRANGNGRRWRGALHAVAGPTYAHAQMGPDVPPIPSPERTHIGRGVAQCVAARFFLEA